MKIFELFATLGLDTGEFNKGIVQSDRQADSFISKMGAKFSKAADTFGKALAVGAGTIATGFAAATKKAFDLFGPLEQNVGGAAAVFGDYFDFVQDKAEGAVRQMGLSVSGYLATINQMGSLAKGAGFDTAEAAEMSMHAMQRASDVASIMGLSSERAMESITGMFKGNFTMMDNLGVTINEAVLAEYALEKGIQKTTQEMSNQERVALAYGLFMERTAEYAGNYARENNTLSGSYEVLKASWENFLVGTEGSAETFVWAIENAAGATTRSLGQIVPKLGESMMEALEIAFPKLVEAGKEGANRIISGINSTFGTKIPEIKEIRFPTASEFSTFVSSWWSDIANPILTTATQWTFNNFVLPKWGEMVDKVSLWWSEEIKPDMEKATKWLASFDLPSWDRVKSAVTSWWSGMKANLEKLAHFYVSYDVNRVYSQSELDAAKDWSIDTTSGATTPVKTPHAYGLPYVPFDNYSAYLHRGETVLTRQQAEAWRSGGSSGGITRADLDALADRIVAGVASMSLNIDGKRAGDILTEAISENIARRALL